MIILYISIPIICLLFLLILYAIYVHNTLARFKTLYEEAFSTMDIYLTKRFDLLSRLLEIAKGYAFTEKKTLESIVSARNSYLDQSNEDKILTNLKIDERLKGFLMVMEAYPELKSNENFITLSSETVKIENEIEKSRRYYNGVARAFNNVIVTFPSSLFAKLFHYNKVTMFQMDEKKREDVEMSL